ncbi:MAG: helix-turn-helix transcriptional regulator [Eggerthellaceae bacterium]|nr:helix-turn-helix transcriptional regulator [Eggerthellaceae bacterium]
MAKIGENIKNLREAAGMSQDQLADHIGKTRSAVSQYESGKIMPRMGVIEDLAHLFKVPKTEIIGERIDCATVNLAEGSLTSSERALVSFFREMDSEGRVRLMEQAAFLKERHPRP